MRDTVIAKGTAQGSVGKPALGVPAISVSAQRVKDVGSQSVGSGERREFWLLYGVSKQNICYFLFMKLLF